VAEKTKRGGRKPAAKAKAPAKKAAPKAKAAAKPPARQQPARRGKTPAAEEPVEEQVAAVAAPVAHQEYEVHDNPMSMQPDESFMVDLSMPATQETAQQKSVAQVVEQPATIVEAAAAEEEEMETQPQAVEVEKKVQVKRVVPEISPLAVKVEIRGAAPAAAVEEEEEEAVADAAVAPPVPSAESNETATPASIRDASDGQKDVTTAATEVDQPVLEATQLIEEEEEELAEVVDEDDDNEDMVDAVSMPAPEEEEQEDIQEEPLAVMKEASAQKIPSIAVAEEEEEGDGAAVAMEEEEEEHDGVEIIDEDDQELHLEASAPSGEEEPEEQQGIAANLVSTIRSFLPTGKPSSPTQQAAKPKKHPKVKALEAAEAARKKEAEKAAERLRQKHEAERIRQERIKTKAAAEAEAARTREEARLKREEEAAQRKKEREELERREREEKARRLEVLKLKRKEEAAAAAAAAAAARAGAESRPAVASTSAANSLAEAKERLAKIQQQTALLAQQATKPSTSVGATIQPTRLPDPGAAAAPKMALAPSAAAAPSALPSNSQIIDSTEEAVPQTYEISPYKSDFESDDDEPKKPVPEWARGKALVTQLVAQTYIDPDEVFQHHNKTCTLDEVFAQRNEAKGGRQDFSRRSSSGNWFEDRVTWKEELAYKKAMGYI
jgi:hypothetical protein